MKNILKVPTSHVSYYESGRTTFNDLAVNSWCQSLDYPPDLINDGLTSYVIFENAEDLTVFLMLWYEMLWDGYEFLIGKKK